MKMKYEKTEIEITETKIGAAEFKTKAELNLALGYAAMSSVNLALAEEGTLCDGEALLRCEQILAESE